MNEGSMMQELTGFTIDRNPSVDSQLAEQMKAIVDEITKTYGDVYSIILAGGFGRGEGSIKIVEGRVVPLKDFDIYVITDRKIREEEYMSLIKKIHRRIGIDSSWYFSVGPGEFNVGIQAIPLRKLERLPPDIASIDLKMASKILYGEDLRKKINLGLNDIILSTGALVLFNKTIGLLEQMDPSLLGKALDREKKSSIVYECGKTFIEICTAMTILAKKYVPSYSKRAENFEKICAKEFPDLLWRMPDLPSKVAFFTNLKLKSSFNEFDEDPIELWFTTRRYFNEVFRYYMQKFLNIESSDDDWASFSKKMYHELGFKFFTDYIHYNLRNFKVYHREFLPILSIIGQIYDNINFIRRLRSIKKKLYLLPILSWRSPLMKIFPAATLTLNALEENGNVNDDFLKNALYYLKKAYPIRISPGPKLEVWKTFRNACVESQKLYFTRKEIIAI